MTLKIAAMDHSLYSPQAIEKNNFFLKGNSQTYDSNNFDLDMLQTKEFAGNEPFKFQGKITTSVTLPDPQTFSMVDYEFLPKHLKDYSSIVKWLKKNQLNFSDIKMEDRGQIFTALLDIAHVRLKYNGKRTEEARLLLDFIKSTPLSEQAFFANLVDSHRSFIPGDNLYWRLQNTVASDTHPIIQELQEWQKNALTQAPYSAKDRIYFFKRIAANSYWFNYGDTQDRKVLFNRLAKEEGFTDVSLLEPEDVRNFLKNFKKEAGFNFPLALYLIHCSLSDLTKIPQDTFTEMIKIVNMNFTEDPELDRQREKHHGRSYFGRDKLDYLDLFALDDNIFYRYLSTHSELSIENLQILCNVMINNGYLDLAANVVVFFWSKNNNLAIEDNEKLTNMLLTALPAQVYNKISDIGSKFKDQKNVPPDAQKTDLVCDILKQTALKGSADDVSRLLDFHVQYSVLNASTAAQYRELCESSLVSSAVKQVIADKLFIEFTNGALKDAKLHWRAEPFLTLWEKQIDQLDLTPSLLQEKFSIDTLEDWLKVLKYAKKRTMLSKDINKYSESIVLNFAHMPVSETKPIVLSVINTNPNNAASIIKIALSNKLFSLINSSEFPKYPVEWLHAINGDIDLFREFFDREVWTKMASKNIQDIRIANNYIDKIDTYIAKSPAKDLKELWKSIKTLHAKS